MNSIVMSANLDKSSIFYRHKKFDQSKRALTDILNSSSTDSLNSSSTDYEYLKVKAGGLNESFVTHTTTSEPSDCHRSFPMSGYKRSSAEILINVSGGNSNEMLPAVKRKHTISESESGYPSAFSPLFHQRLTSTPVLSAAMPPAALAHLSYTSNDIGVNSNKMPAAKRKRTISGNESSYSSAFSSLPQIHLTSIPYPSSVLTPVVAPLPKISNETLSNICKYHGNMVRKFPKKERTPKDQERRNKNTIACRNSRRLKKLEHIVIEEQYKEFSQKTFEIIEKSMRAAAYLHELMKLSTKCSQAKGEEISATTEAAAAVLATTSQQKKPFTIAYLMGIKEN